MAKSWALSSWQAGQVTLLQALGIQNQAFNFPSLSATLPSQEQSAQNTPSQPTSTTGSVATNLTTYTQSQLQQLWIQAGGNPAYATIASAIAMAESSGNAGATDNDSNGSVDRGLWQINSVHGTQSTFDPLANARAAVAISANGTNWSPWVTYNNGAYLKYM